MNTDSSALSPIIPAASCSRTLLFLCALCGFAREKPAPNQTLLFLRLFAPSREIKTASDPEEIDAEFQRALAAIGEALGVDRCFTFLVNADGSGHRVRHVWTAPGIAPYPRVVGQLMQEAFP